MKLGSLLCALASLLTVTGELNAQSTGPCPDEFFGAPLHPQMRLCQSFDEQLPASLSFHVPQSQQALSDYYIQSLGNDFRIRKQVKRIVLDHPDKPIVVILSVDGEGTQVDILVKESQPS